MQITIYTDGACRKNPGPGGYGILLQFGPHTKEISCGYRKTTNNRMELLAVIVGLSALKNPGMQVKIISDSRYVIDGATKYMNSWQRKGFADVKNTDLWQAYLKVSACHQVEFEWVKGHSGHPQNERCDQMAVDASYGKSLLIDQGYESVCELISL